ncbi:hypothetical protein L249_3632 [Ophiocordyceps polyrhachis-furcata BCC 54312]|uniref:Uncharacterized protein n=1 Tax=Ophiocordyceps polyrhachis-furcata BCC 54312 TaxID=1330021 RepID=A0A367LMJ3_9HYPO|nr:hypothetical protein L249_3632 [Ophiocordyceps polyrhachis-furcata BCC 54312]
MEPLGRTSRVAFAPTTTGSAACLSACIRPPSLPTYSWYPYLFYDPSCPPGDPGLPPAPHRVCPSSPVLRSVVEGGYRPIWETKQNK